MASAKTAAAASRSVFVVVRLKDDGDIDLFGIYSSKDSFDRMMVTSFGTNTKLSLLEGDKIPDGMSPGVDKVCRIDRGPKPTDYYVLETIGR